MGTRFDMVMPLVDNEMLDFISTLIKEELSRLNDQISNYNKESIISLINKVATQKPYMIEENIWDILCKVKHVANKTRGYFAPLAGRKTLEKDIVKQQNVPLENPESDDFSSVNVKMLLNPEKRTVFFSNPNAMIDSGGWGKGLGLDRAKKILVKNNIETCFISFGGSSILGHGSHPHGKYWPAGIVHLFKENENVCVFPLKNQFLSVSGNTPLNEQKYGRSHIFNPVTKAYQTGNFQSAVAGPEGLTTEILSTTLACATNSERMEIMEEFKDYSAVVIEYDDQQKAQFVFDFNFSDHV